MDQFTKQKISEKLSGNSNRLGKTHSADTKKSISVANKGYKWFNNGEICVKAKECPEGFNPGRIKTNFGWFTNFEENVWSDKCPEGFVKGRAHPNEGKVWFNDGNKNYLLSEDKSDFVDENHLTMGMLKKKPAQKKVKVQKQYTRREMPRTYPPKVVEDVDPPIVQIKPLSQELTSNIKKKEIDESTKAFIEMMNNREVKESYVEMFKKFEN